jgi:type II secretory pathway pseudopilin PulG
MWAMSKAALLAVKLLLPKLAPYVMMILGTIAVLGVVYSKGKNEAEKKAAIERLASENAALRQVIQTQREAIEQDNEIALQNAETIIALEDKTKELISRVQNPSNVCLDADDTERLRDIWKEYDGTSK